MVDFNVYECEKYALSMGINFEVEPTSPSRSNVYDDSAAFEARRVFRGTVQYQLTSSRFLEKELDTCHFKLHPQFAYCFQNLRSPSMLY